MCPHQRSFLWPLEMACLFCSVALEDVVSSPKRYWISIQASVQKGSGVYHDTRGKKWDVVSISPHHTIHFTSLYSIFTNIFTMICRRTICKNRDTPVGNLGRDPELVSRWRRIDLGVLLCRVDDHVRPGSCTHRGTDQCASSGGYHGGRVTWHYAVWANFGGLQGCLGGWRRLTAPPWCLGFHRSALLPSGLCRGHCEWCSAWSSH